MKQIIAVACLFGGTALLADTHPDFTGSWHFEAAKSQIHSKAATEWEIRQNGDSISIEERVPGHSESLTCETTGKTCRTKGAEVTFYYNGPLLIETDLIGHDKERVVKKRMKLEDDGKTLEVEVEYINPQAASEKLLFEKQ